MNNSPLPKETDDNYDPNVEIDQEIYDRLWDTRFKFGAPVDDEPYQYNFEMRPYIYPDVE